MLLLGERDIASVHVPFFVTGSKAASFDRENAKGRRDSVFLPVMGNENSLLQLFELH